MLFNAFTGSLGNLGRARGWNRMVQAIDALNSANDMADTARLIQGTGGQLYEGNYEGAALNAGQILAMRFALRQVGKYAADPKAYRDNYGPQEGAAYSGGLPPPKSLRGGGSVRAYEVGPHNVLQDRSKPFDKLQIHHAGQSHAMKQITHGYDPDTGPAIAIPNREHYKIPKLSGTVNLSPRQLLARDIINLRKYTNAPISSLKELIKLNKQMYPGVFKK